MSSTSINYQTWKKLNENLKVSVCSSFNTINLETKTMFSMFPEVQNPER